MEYRQFLKSLVPDRVTLKADTIQDVLKPLPLRTPDILTGSRMHVMMSPFGMRGHSSTLQVDPRCNIPKPQVTRRDLASQFGKPHVDIFPARDAAILRPFLASPSSVLPFASARPSLVQSSDLTCGDVPVFAIRFRTSINVLQLADFLKPAISRRFT